MIHAGMHTLSKVKIHYIDSEQLEKTGVDCLKGMDAILVPGGFGKRGVEGKMAAIRYARENKVPYLGICLGMQLAVVEYARDVAGMTDAHSTEFEPATTHPVIGLITEWLDRGGQVEKRSEQSDLGGTMRLGGQPCELKDGTLAHEVYGAASITNAIATATKSTTPCWPNSRPKAWWWPDALRVPTCAKSSNCRPRCIPGSSPASSTQNSPATRATAIRFSSHS